MHPVILALSILYMIPWVALGIWIEGYLERKAQGKKEGER